MRNNAGWFVVHHAATQETPFRVRVNALLFSGTLKYSFTIHVQKQHLRGFFWARTPHHFCISHPQYFDMFSDLVDMRRTQATICYAVSVCLTI